MQSTKNPVLTVMVLLTFVAMFVDTGVLMAETQENGGNTAAEVSSDGTVSTGLDAMSGGTQVLETGSTQQLDQRAVKRAEFLQNIRDELKATQHDYSNITHSVDEASGRVSDIEDEVVSLQEQLDNIDTRIALTQTLISNVALQINQKESLLIQLYDDIETKKLEIENQKNMLMDYLKTIYMQESSVTNTLMENDQINVAKLLLSDDSIGDQLQQMKYFNILENTGHDIFDKLESLITELHEDEGLVNEQKDRLVKLHERLDLEKVNLDVQRKAKTDLLEQTKGEQKIYEQLLAESKLQQEQVQLDLQTLRDNLKFIEQKVKDLGDDFDPQDYEALIHGDKTSVYQFIRDTQNQEDFSPSWPVSPGRGISAYFHDASYVKVFGVNHQAIDIPTHQGTPIRAPEDGVAYKVRDNGYGYSYLIIAHKGGFMTVYGHVSEFRVEEGEKVYRGQTIALSGATPGTKGAGYMTTGAHLHFEVLKGGKHVDPLDYLPLSYLPLDSLPEKYKNRVTGDSIKFKRVNPEDLPVTDDEITQKIEMSGSMEQVINRNQSLATD